MFIQLDTRPDCSGRGPVGVALVARGEVGVPGTASLAVSNCTIILLKFKPYLVRSLTPHADVISGQQALAT